ncbi:MAG: hypothetical protein QUS14_01310 [Pyrinomonadaceae bacterium]|nr:hypothetical protein [Pyrinomonadaceae bacterium]
MERLALSIFLFGVMLLGSCSRDKNALPVAEAAATNTAIERISTVGFEQVINTPDGERVTLTEFIDIKNLCLDFSSSQREICTTSIVNANHQPFHIVEIRLRVCSETLSRNCIVFGSNPRNIDFREVYVLDDDGNVIDFDGQRLIEPPNTWTAEPIRLKLTGRVTVINGKGKLVEPIERIEKG